MGWLEWKSRYFSVWVGFQLTVVFRVLSGLQVMSTSKKASFDSGSFSIVICMVCSMELMWWWNLST